MTLPLMQNPKELKNQYKNSGALEIRRSFHKKYSTNKPEYDQWILQQIPFSKDQRILDIGCGNGKIWRKGISIIQDAEKLVLADLSQGMLDEAKASYREFKNIEFQLADICDLPFENESFDIILADSMLYHVADLDKALAESYRVLKPNGILAATTFSENGLNAYINDAVFEMGLTDAKTENKISFSLENGADSLKKYFSDLSKLIYDDLLRVTNIWDLIDYIYSMTSMSHLSASDKPKMLDYFEKQKNANGEIEIPKMYGMYLAVKRGK